MFYVALLLITLYVDDLFLAVNTLLHSDGREKSYHLIILILCPLIKAVIVTLIANHANAQKNLGRRFHGHLGILGDAEEIRCRIFERASLSGQNFPNPLIVGFVFGQRASNPVAILPNAFVADKLARVLKQ